MQGIPGVRGALGLLAIIVLLVPATQAAQTRLVWSDSDVRLTDPATMFPGPVKTMYETHAGIDPTDPDRMLAFGIDLSTQNVDEGYSTNRGYRSTDGGVTWADTGPVSYRDAEVWGGGDPVVVFAPDGTAYFASLASPDDGETGGVWVHRSRDGGMTWDAPVLAVAEVDSAGACTATDKEWLSHDRFTGTLFVTYTEFQTDCGGEVRDPLGATGLLSLSGLAIRMVQSVDDGKTWTTPLTIWDGYALGSIPRVSKDGTLHVAFWGTVETSTVPCPTILSAVTLKAEGANPFPAIIIARSTDDGATWSYHEQGFCVFDLAESSKPGRVVGGNFLPSFSLDPATGLLTVAYTDYLPAENRFTVKVITSSDGQDWSTPRQVTPGRHDARMPAIAATDGETYLLYLQTEDTGQTGHTMLVQSHDQGQTWSEPFMVSMAPSLLAEDPEIGDYLGLDVAGGRLVATWTDARSGTSEIWGRSARLCIPEACPAIEPTPNSQAGDDRATPSPAWPLVLVALALLARRR